MDYEVECELTAEHIINYDTVTENLRFLYIKTSSALFLSLLSQL